MVRNRNNGSERRISNPYSKKRLNNNNNAGKDPVLQHILKQLRPFQKEAYEFCTQGILPKRNCANFENFENHDKRKAVKPEQTIVHNPELLGKGRILLADEMGLGKTVTSLAIMAHYRAADWPLLILCPASLRYTWPGEIEKFMPSLPASSIYVVNGFDDADFFENDNKRSRIQIVVATYSLLQKRSAAAKALEQFQFQSIIVDESHNLKQRNTQRCKLALPLLEQAKRLVLLSGTPALAKPVELWTQISTLAPGLFANNYTQFTKRYCNARRGRFGWDVNGLSNADELHSRLQQIMVRRLKADVLDELPPKQRTIVKINVPKGEKRKDSESILQDLDDTRQSLHDLVGEEADGANFEARTLLMQAYQASGIAKSSGVVDYLLEWLKGSGTQKVLIFAHHKGVLDALEVAVAKEYKATAHIRIDGTVNSLERAARVRKFQTSSKIRVGILSITAAGVGLTLTAATTVMFAELHWTPGVLAQAEDRCHRIGQKNAVNILYLICQDAKVSVDPQLWKMLARKIGTLGKVIDGEKNASMNAKEAPANGIPNSRKRQSVQDELQSFFAETSPNDTSGASPKVPVEGTIMSFFKKQTEPKPKDAAKSKEKSTLPKDIKQSPFVKSVSKHTNTTTPQKIPLTYPPKSSMVEWTCDKCTFINSQLRPKGGWLKCSMCGSHHLEESKMSSSEVTPNSTRTVIVPASSQEDPIVLDGSDDGEMDTARKDTVHNIWNPKKRGRTKAHHIECGVVVLNDNVDPKQNQVSPNVVLLHDEEQGESSKPLQKKRKAGAQEVICLEGSENNTRGEVNLKYSEPSKLKFSVSKNSGRITIHYAETNEPSLINFSLEQVLTEDTATRLLDTKVHRRSNRTQRISLLFEVPATNQIISRLDSSKVNGSFRRDSLRSEIEQFVCSFQALREVEKQAIKESGKSFSSRALKQAASKLIVSSTTASIERYSGGAKERARERMEHDTADEKDKAILEGRLCAWCGGQLPIVSRVAGVASTYCSRECAEQGRLKRGGMFASSRIREQLFALEGGVCRMCKIDAHALFTRISALHPAERLNALINANWRLPKTSKAMDRLLQTPKEGDFWQADHIKAVAEGGGGCGLENIRTLCVPCHSEETERLRGRLKLAGGAKQASKRDRRQRDIRAMFGVNATGEK